MSDLEHANGHKPADLDSILNPGLARAERPDPAALDYDLDAALAAVVGLNAVAPEDAFSASYLGTEREGSAILIDDIGHLLTIGYLINEAEQVTLTTGDGKRVPAQVTAYDYRTGFGLLRAAGPLGARPLLLGDSAAVAEQDRLVVASRGGSRMAIYGSVVSKREFAGYWEYLLDEAIFTMPAHPAWSGAALIDGGGRLVGLGSLFVQDALPDGGDKPGNMFIPIDLLKPILNDLVTRGHSRLKVRPWVGIYCIEALGRVLITSMADNGPAAEAGIQPGDVVLAVNGTQVNSISGMYRRMWDGSVGEEIVLTVQRDAEKLQLSVTGRDRGEFMKAPRRH